MLIGNKLFNELKDKMYFRNFANYFFIRFHSLAGNTNYILAALAVRQRLDPPYSTQQTPHIRWKTPT